MTDYARIARRIALTLFVSQSLGSAGFITAATINSILGAKLSGRPAWAGIPTGVYLLGSALAAYGWGYAFDRLGRRNGLVLGLLAGVCGAGLAGAAVIVASFALLLVGLLLMGTAHAALQLSRFVAAEVYPVAQRGRAISNVVVGGTVGAVLGPLLVGPVGQWAQRAGVDQLAGPYGASLVLFALAGVVIAIWLRPDPRDVGRQVALLHPESAGLVGQARPLLSILQSPAAFVAVMAMVCGQVTMVMLMVITALHMTGHQHSLHDISLVIASHTFGMYAFAIVSGRLADRLGRGSVIVAGAGTLVIACLAAPLSPAVLPVAVALFLLGLGWNFCFVGGSSLLADQLSPAERARTQGFNDLLIGLVSAAGSLGSGLVFAAVGFGVMSLLGAVTALVPLCLTLWWMLSRRASVVT